jgi:hypothetical protein
MPIQPILDLARFLATSPYASGLFPLTSMATLRIGRYPDFLPGDGELMIELAPSGQTFIFTYQSHPAQPAAWQHQYPISEGRIAIKRFLHDYARWFSESGLPRFDQQ